jgi:hypothetical protein
VAVHAAVCGCPAVRHYVALCSSVRQCEAVRQCDSARGSVWQYVEQCGSAAGQSVRLRVAVRAALCGSAAMCGTQYGSVRQCTAVCDSARGSVRQCGSVRQGAVVCDRAAVCGNAAVRQRVQQCGKYVW